MTGLPKSLQKHTDDSSRRSQKRTEQHLKNCWLHLSQLRSDFIIQRLSKNGIQGKTYCWPNRTPKLISHLPKSILMIPKTFGRIFCHLMREKFNFFGRFDSHYTWYETNTAFIKRTLVKHSGCSVVVCHALLHQHLDDLLMELQILVFSRKSWKRNPLPSVCALKLMNSWDMQQNNDLKHTSKSSFEGFQKTNKKEGFAVVWSKSGVKSDWDGLAWP